MVEVIPEASKAEAIKGDAASPLLAWTLAFAELTKKSHYSEATGPEEA